MKLKIKRLHKDAIIPVRAYETDAGLDLFSIEQIIIPSGQVKKVKTGIAIQLPDPYTMVTANGEQFEVLTEAQVRPRSGLAANRTITVLNAPGTIDFGYSSDISVLLYNAGSYSYEVQVGDKIAQLVVSSVLKPVIEVVDELPETVRGSNGFGSTGK